MRAIAKRDVRERPDFQTILSYVKPLFMASPSYPIVDCDVHQGIPDSQEIVRRLPAAFRERGIKTLNRSEYPNPHGGARNDASGSNYELLRAGLLNEHDFAATILTGGYTRVGMLPDLDYAAALLSAYNDTVADYWFDKDERLLGAITVAMSDPVQAAREIRRLGSDPRWAMVTINSTTYFPLGNRFYHPVFEACAEMNLPLALHPGGEGTGASHPPTANGFPTTYLEWHTNLSASYMTQTCSVLCEGVFEKYPAFRMILLEGGFSWLPHLKWRLDKNWKGLRSSVPWLKAAPSEYIAGHLWLSTQPIEEPPHRGQLEQMIEIAQVEDALLFSSDFPHWDFDDPHHALRPLSAPLKEKIYFKNALQALRLPSQIVENLTAKTQATANPARELIEA